MVNILFINAHFEIEKGSSNDNIETKFEGTTTPQTGYNYPIPDNPLTLPTRRTTLPTTHGIDRIHCCNDHCTIWHTLF